MSTKNIEFVFTVIYGICTIACLMAFGILIAKALDHQDTGNLLLFAIGTGIAAYAAEKIADGMPQ